MGRFAVVVLAGFTLAGCVSTHVAAQDFTTGHFTICGNNKASMEDLNAKAQQTCSAGPKPLRCAEQAYGSKTHSTGSAYGQSGFAVGSGTSTTHALVGNCCEYACPLPGGPAAR
jgi:hypothetical protein